MELDELKSAWQVLDKRLETSNRLQLQAYREKKLGLLNRRLRPLFWGQVVQILLGGVMVLLAIAFWEPHRHELLMLLSGLVVHGYGVALIISAAVTLARISAIDDAAPVIVIQKQLAYLRRFRVISGLWAGLPWWFLWMPLMAMGARWAAGINLYTKVPSVFVLGTAIGLLGLAATWWFHHWSRDPSRPHMARSVDDAMSGHSLRAAQQVLDEIAAFEAD